jgi:hypothetical protein
MLLFLIGLSYISFICFGWGSLIFSHRRGLGLPDMPGNIPLLCIAGALCLSVLFSIFSLFFPLDSALVQALILLPVLVTLWRNEQFRESIMNLPASFFSLRPEIRFLLGALLLLVLVLQAWDITHPDTLGYHAEIIAWIERYRIIPGLVHLNPRIGLQNNWFVLCAAFSFHFLGLKSLTLINGCFAFWFFWFVVVQIDAHLKQRENGVLKWLGWTALLLFSLANYQLARLTITSAHPDFIASLAVWVCFLIFLKTKTSSSSEFALFVLASIAITIKLSVLPVMLLTVPGLWRDVVQKRMPILLKKSLIFAVIAVPFLARQVITTGFPAFPSPWPDLISADWKFPRMQAELMMRYIKAYAIAPIDYDANMINKQLNEPLLRLALIWWKARTFSDKSFFIILGALCIQGLRSGMPSWNRRKWIALLTAASGTMFWFFLAPDPRFGYGFLIPMAAFLLPYKSPVARNLYKLSKAPKLCIITVTMLVFAYVSYRIAFYSDASRLVCPNAGPLAHVAVFPCSDSATPCSTIYGKNVQFRGPSIKDGFRPR